MTRKPTGVGEEIKQRRPFVSTSAEGVVGLLRTADVLRRRLGGLIEPHGITFQQYNVLRILRGAGDAGLPTLEIAERMVEKAPGITRLVDRLEAKRLVRRERGSADRRQVLCWITPTGLGLLSRLDPEVIRADEALSVLPGRDLTHLIQSLDTIRAACRAPESNTALPRTPGPTPERNRNRSDLMKTRTLLTLAVAALGALPLAAADGWTVDKTHSDVSFQVRHFVSKTRGRFKDFSGAIQVDPAKPEAATVEFTIQTASIDTADEKRDGHLKSPDFFDAEKNPTITFKSSSVKATGKDRYDVTGAFTMHGVTKTITLPVTLLGLTKDPWGNERGGFEIVTKLNRKEYGISWNKALDNGGVMLGEDVDVSITLETVKKKDAPAAPAPAAK